MRRYLVHPSRLGKIGLTSASAAGNTFLLSNKLSQPKSDLTFIASHIVEQTMVHVGLTCHQFVRFPRLETLDAVGHVHYAGRSAMGKGQNVSLASRVASHVMALVIGLDGWIAKT
jgi:hypothetical protein